MWILAMRLKKIPFSNIDYRVRATVSKCRTDPYDMTIRIFNYSPELLRRLRGLVEVQGSDLLLLDLSDPVPLASFAGLSKDPIYQQWSSQNGIYFILREQIVADIGMSAPDDPKEDALSGRVAVHACARLVRKYFLDQFEVTFLPLANTFRSLIMIVEDALIDTLNTPDFRKSRREQLPVCQYQLIS
jgi:hypothetical protein